MLGQYFCRRCSVCARFQRISFDSAKVLPPGAAQRLLDHSERETARGKRNYTILLLLTRLGLRAGEIVALELDGNLGDCGGAIDGGSVFESSSETALPDLARFTWPGVVRDIVRCPP